MTGDSGAPVPDLNLWPRIACGDSDCRGSADTDGTSWWCDTCDAVWELDGTHGERTPSTGDAAQSGASEVCKCPCIDARGLCDCDCVDCTISRPVIVEGEQWIDYECICRDCDAAACGLHQSAPSEPTP